MTISMETPSTNLTKSFIIADASGLFSLLDKNDPRHKVANSAIDFLSDHNEIILPSEIFAETLNAIWKKVGKQNAVRAGKDLLNPDFNIHIMDTQIEIRLKAVKKFEEIRSNLISFTDCLVMVFADHFKTKLIFGFDEHFKKNGYQRLGIDS